MTDETIIMSTEIGQDNFSPNKDRFDFIIEHDVDIKWYQVLKRLTDIDSSKLEGFRKIISRTSNEKITCLLMKDNHPVGIVLGVIEKPYIGIFDLVVHLDYRRQGIGEFIMRIMMSYAHKSKLQTMYL
ncbi:MAG: GNAT family N-acetyltransferase [Candidatus Heimdallarchaeota archaeon]|nr:GNAT family N-acetyltransferase [Candidatus Heimdallarchaeota archaeon]